MGYDMYTVTKDPGEDEAVAEIRTLMYAARNEGRRDDVEKLYNEMRAAERSYFRLNIWGMGKACDLMHGAGMLDLERPAETRFPSEDDFDISAEMWEAWDGEPDDNTPEPLRNFLAACDAATDYQKPEPPGIPAHKLGSNDGWLVTPDEIASALERYVLGNGVPADAPVWWADWISWLRYAQAHGGFRVH